jgi:hypothetical protein
MKSLKIEKQKAGIRKEFEEAKLEIDFNVSVDCVGCGCCCCL